MNAPAPFTTPDLELDHHSHEQVELALAQYRNEPGPLLQVLHAVQAKLGFIPRPAVRVIAEGLNLSRADVHGTVTFYHYFRQTPPGEHIIQLCQAEACRSMHCETLTEHVKQRLGVGFHSTTPDGRYSLEPVYCLGLCACSPALMIDGDVHGRVTPARFDELLGQQETAE